MRIYHFLILGIAAGAGALVFQVIRPAPETGQSLYDSATGSGSLWQTVKHAKEDADRKKEKKFSLYGGEQEEHYSIPDDVALLIASAKGDQKVVAERIAMGVKIDSRDTERRTPLMFASARGYKEICGMLLQAGANIRMQDRSGRNALDYAAGRGLVDTVEFLLKKAKDTDERHYIEYATLNAIALTANTTSMPKGKGALPSINRISPEEWSPLHIAAGNGSVNVIELLLSRGADINLSNAQGRTPLHWAAWSNQTAAINLLSSRNARIDARDIAGNTPLMLAAQHGSMEATKALLDAGANKTLVNVKGETAADRAANKELAALLQ